MKRKRKIETFLSHDTNISENNRWNKQFWEQVSDDDKFAAAWELVTLAWEVKGRKASELRLKRTIGLFKPA
jgi:hypothetical protein